MARTTRPGLLAMVLLLAAAVTAVLARPAIDEEPVKISLGTGKEDRPVTTLKPRVDVGTRIRSGREWLERMADAIRFGRGRLVNSVAIARNILAERVEELMSETRNNVAGAIGAANDIIEKSRALASYERAPLAQFFPPKTRETVRLENESDASILEKRRQNPITRILENIVKPTPIVDNIKEEDKYGNNGDKFIGVSRALVSGLEGIGNLLDRIANFPLSSVKDASRGITEALNQIGARIVGLQ